MTFQTVTSTGTGVTTLSGLSATSNVYVFVKGSNADRYDIKFKVNTSGLRRVMDVGETRRGSTRIKQIDVPASEISIDVSNNASGDIVLEVKEY